MATNFEGVSDSSLSDFSDTDTDIQSSSDSDQEATASKPKQKACRYYNSGHCRNGNRCRDLHVCKYFLNGACRYGAACRLQHIQSSDHTTGEIHRGRRRHGKNKSGRRDRSSSSGSLEDSDRPYRWQLDLGTGWEDVANDHILEAQYSRPNTKGIRIYNTPSGALSIDFTRMCILKKRNLRVRRKGSSQTEWLWYYHGNHGWCQYGKKDSKGKTSSVSSSTLEKEFQKNKKGAVKFDVDCTAYEICFKNMSQKNLDTGHSRRIRRRPKYESLQGRIISSVKKSLKNLSLSSSKKTPVWQFNGSSDRWHTFKKRHSCSVSSEDIEVEFQRNPQGLIRFTVNGESYKLDFSSMRQINEKTNASRKVQRVLQ